MEEKALKFDQGGFIVAAGALLVGLYVVWEAQDFSSLGSIFPIFVAGVLLITAAVLGGGILLRRVKPPRPISGSHLRRGALALALLAWAALVPVLGFTLASILGFLAVGLTSKYDAWTFRNWAVFGVSAVVGVVVFCFIFTAFLKVPLPGGLLAP